MSTCCGFYMTTFHIEVNTESSFRKQTKQDLKT